MLRILYFVFVAKSYTVEIFRVLIFVQMKRGDPIADVEYDRSCTNCTQQRIHRQANTVSRAMNHEE